MLYTSTKTKPTPKAVGTTNFCIFAPMKAHYTIAAFTGHRSYDHSADQALRRVIERLYGQGVRCFRSGMAEGFDLSAAEAVIDLKERLTELRLEAIVPYPAFKERMGLCDQSRYERIVRLAESVHYAADEYFEGVYRLRNDLLVEDADVVVAWWNGRRSGTQYTVQQARRRAAHIINIYHSEQLDINF